VLVDGLIVWDALDWHHWRTPTHFLANIILVAVFGLMIRLVQDLPVAEPLLQAKRRIPLRACPCADPNAARECLSVNAGCNSLTQVMRHN
jgi:hypothetical protein